MVVENPNVLGKVGYIIFLDARSNCRTIYGVQISHYSDFYPISIALWYENNIIIFFLSIVIDSDK